MSDSTLSSAAQPLSVLQSASHLTWMPAADYLLVVVVAVVLSGANVVGYTKCSKQASAQLRSYATQAVTSGLTVGGCHALLAALIYASFPCSSGWT